MFNKKIILALVVFVTIMVTMSVYLINISAHGKSTTTVFPVVATKLVKIDGMNCEACEKALDAAAKNIKGVISIKASAVNQNAILKYDMVKTDISSVMYEIKKAGYKATSYEDYKEPKTVKKAPVVMKCGKGKCGSK